MEEKKKKSPKNECLTLDVDTEIRVHGLATVIAKLEGAHSVLNGCLKDMAAYSLYDEDVRGPVHAMCEQLSWLEVLVAMKLGIIGSIRKVEEKQG